MDKISLSIEELIYCFYSEGFFEQGNALKQVYFGDLDDEKMDLLLQISTRSLLSKSLVSYKNHKFTLVEELADIIATLNYSDQSIKVSRHDGEGGEKAVSYHLTGNGFIQHSLFYDEQIHVFSIVTLNEVSELVSDFYYIQNDRETGTNGFSLSQQEFEVMIDSLEDNSALFELPKYEGTKNNFYESLKESNGLLNTMLFFEFNEVKEPEATNLVLFTNNQANNWMIEKREEGFYVKPCNREMVKTLIENSIEVKVKETVSDGK
ncbi:hypothetical protein [Mesobacillus selenatarsenatis]|uniref:Uncharacterized protein n=1 Tax=Mesobacillus selenatarsenatis (strain DSM 18680 / JCM 14380 / FERM P-15431 / SF-1) TaxID=1321606 RepID=A0A0A8X1M6_MESS1|nr:hypothetical protein [Mesobacillus selenatarsenatis]GAM12892.1 unknown [Mesobacillus selenatarsenatis SF-1]